MTIRVLHVPLACCAIEALAATAPLAGLDPDEVRVVERPQEADVLVVSGTATDAVAPVLSTLYAALPPHARVVAFGVCTISGGPYWDSYSVLKGIDQLLPVDVYVPGCPPPPGALAAVFGRLAAGSGGERSIAERADA
ncbi:MAG TPA: hypothetical protein P5181_07135 [Dermatophilaceae bacterium]|nr:hypothetical protein [Dermatophilaceae bacterium]